MINIAKHSHVSMTKLFLTLFLIILNGMAWSQAPVNATCSGAISLSVGSTCSQTSGILNSTYLGPEKFVWYKFTATTSTGSIILYNSANMDGIIELRSSCAASTYLALTNVGIGGATEIMNYSGLSIGTTYFIKV